MAHRFDHSTVFDRIPRTRVAGFAEPARNRLRIELGCDCAVKSFFEEPRLLVIDVSDPVAGAVKPRVEGSASAPPDLERNAPPDRPAPPAELQASLRAPLVARQAYSTSSVTHFAEALASRTTRQVLDIGDPEAPRPASQVTLGSGFPNIDLPNIAVPETGPGDPAGPSARQRLAACTGLVEAPFGPFGGESNFFSAKSRLSVALYTEQLSLDQRAAVELAQLHLSQGLAAEARQILAMIDGPDPERMFLSQLARLIEEPDTLPRSIFEPYRDCSDENAIWPILAAPRRPMSDDDAWQVARAAEALPRALLRVIGPRVIGNLIESGQTDPANMISRTLERSGVGPGRTMADVRLADEAADQEAILTEIARSNGEESAQASAMLVERQIAAGEPVPEPLAQLVASHAEEQRHSEAGGMLRKAEAFSLISQGNFAAALAILQQDTLGPEAQPTVTAQFFRSLAKSADTVTFLRIALAQPALAAATPPEVRQAVAARLYKNRFPEAAARLIADSEPLDGAILAEALGARAYGEVGIPDAVLFQEADTDDPAMSEARYAALLSAGKFVEARQTALGLGKPDPLEPLLTAVAEPEASDDGAGLTLERASALTEATAALAETVTTVLGDPMLRLDP
ncbi:hypothetical protein [Marinovum sp.]|uniref:hypothetical protein n=1 Tax=Marinovum sp. TaxID=2024839 RepID=UPI002B267829|nr:hypothetical protein [Marinovum sp.]